MTNRESSDPYYDLFEDWGLIVSSFLSQYGIRLQTKQFETVSWDEFKSLLAGLAPDTALGRVVAIRAESNPDIIKQFSSDQKRIYDEWKQHEAERMANMPKERFEKEMTDLERMFAVMCG